MASSAVERIQLTNHYLFTGRLIMKTALHIGGGHITQTNSDSPVVLTPEEKPFIPGSSFKGALRSTIERVIPILPEEAGLYSCGLPSAPDPSSPCPTARGLTDVYLTPKDFDKRCHTCKLFGSPYAASRIAISDLYLAKDEQRPSEDDWSGVIQVRDGVAIDRDSGTAVDERKYDFEVVPAETAFHLKITLENATREDLQLLSIGLQEFMSGFSSIGGRRSRGMGVCILDKLTIYQLDLEQKDIKPNERVQHIKNYLLEREPEKKFPHVFSGKEAITFLQARIQEIFEKEKKHDAQ
jgi:CRISPR-associated RAMP protein (TIGR02581 family)